MSIFGLSIAGLILVACKGGATTQPVAQTIRAGDGARGETVYKGTCIACHGPNAKGISGLGKDLTTSEFVKSKTDAELVAFIKTGRPVSDPLNTTGVDMPPRGGNASLTDQDLVDAVAYIQTLVQ